MKRFKEKLKEEEKLALKTAEVQAPKEGKKQYMSEFKAQSNAKRLKKVSRRLNEEYNYCRLMWSLSGARVLIKASSVHGRRTEENIG